MASIASILAAIDNAIAAWAGKPVRIRAADGREVEYRDLRSLTAARREYAALLATQSGAPGFRLTPLAHGDAK